MRKELERKLRGIYDSDDFVTGVLSRVKGKEQKMLDFMEMSESDGEPVGYEEVAMLAYIMNKGKYLNDPPEMVHRST